MAANVEKLHPHAPALDGCVDAVADGRLYGWAWDRERPDDRLAVEVRKGEAVLAVGIADRPRPDLAASGIGDGAHAFELDLPTEAGEEVTVTVCSSTTGESLQLVMRQAPQLDDVPEELQRVTATVHNLSLVQKETATAVLGVLKEMRDKRGSAQITQLEETVAEIAAGQQALQKRFETVEVFLLRFDTLLRQFDERLNAVPKSAPAEANLRRAVVALSVVAATALVAAFIF